MDFRLPDDFIEQYEGIEPPWGPLGLVTFKTKYARPIYAENRLEEWYETVRRVVEGTYTIQRRHCDGLKLPWNHHKAQVSAREMYNLIFNMKFLPPGRGLRNMGSDAMWNKSAALLHNCAYISTKELSTDFAEPFCFLMDMSMLGVGVGTDTLGAGQIKIREPRCTEEPFVIPDTREGWVDMVRILLNAYVGKGAIPNTLDFSQLRGPGLPIRGMGGVSSGPFPLQRLAEDIQDILNPIIGQQITSTAIADLFNAIGRCVVSGGVRRTAEILFGSPSDREFLELKDPDKHLDMLDKWRWTSNNSVFANVGMDYTEVAQRTASNGEPGYVWMNNARKFGRLSDSHDYRDSQCIGTNPCGEQLLENAELCTLCEVFPAAHDSYSELERTLKFAYIYAKSVSLLSTHNIRTNAVLLRNRRLGISMSGIAQASNKHGVRNLFDWCDKGYKYLRETDRLYSREWLCVQESVRLTTVKPSGTVSLLNGSTPGIHFPHSKYYYRTMRFAKNSQIVDLLKAAEYRVENDLADNSSLVAYFPVHENKVSKYKKDVSMWEQLEIAAQMQAWWSDNSVSSTITFKPKEAKDLKIALSLYETRLKSVSFLPLTDHGYPQAPYIEIDQKEYEAYVTRLKPLVLSGLRSEVLRDNEYCDSDKCEVKFPNTDQ